MNYTLLISAIAEAHQQAQAGAAGAVNRHHLLRNWLIGAYLVEFEQSGEDRAKYGAGLLKRVSADLRAKTVPGTSPDMLERMRRFYCCYPQVQNQISAPAVRKLTASSATPGKSAPVARKSGAVRLPTSLSPERVVALSWTHLAELVRLEDPWKRAFYENECLQVDGPNASSSARSARSSTNAPAFRPTSRPSSSTPARRRSHRRVKSPT